MNEFARPGLPRTVIPAEQIQKRVREMGRQISDDYRGQSIHLLALLENGFIFMPRDKRAGRHRDAPARRLPPSASGGEAQRPGRTRRKGAEGCFSSVGLSLWLVDHARQCQSFLISRRM
jgi:hypothetical protein